MNNTVPEARAIRIVLYTFRDRGWQDVANTALAVVEGIFADSKFFDSQQPLKATIPDQFLLINDVSSDDIREALMSQAANLVKLAIEASAKNNQPIVQMADIDSFSRVRNIAAPDVAHFANPLDLLEDVVERMIARVIGEVYLVKDWAGEADDMYSAQIMFNGRNVRASFLLKGSGLRGPLKPKNLGHNGDQITRMMTQPAELFVVQHVGRVEPSVRKQLHDSVVARRSEGNRTAVGTVWDGIDTARLGVAYGFLDPATGALKPGAVGEGS